MKEVFISLNHPGSDWGEDIVRFYIPDNSIAENHISADVENVLKNLDTDSFYNSQDMADEALDRVAQMLNGSWEYIQLSGSVYVSAYK